MRNVRFFYRQFNMNTTSSGVGKIHKTLKHSLRIPSADTHKKIEWDASLSAGNLLWFNESTKPLASYDLKERQAIFDTIAPQPKLKNQSQLKAQHRQLKHKIKKAREVERNKGNEYAAYLMQKIYETEAQAEVSEDLIDSLDTLTDISRYKQKLKTAKKFARVHNSLLGTKSNKNATYLQEGIFKIPHRWQVDDTTITPSAWLNYTKRCLEHFFPYYPIHALVVHTDERLKDEYTGTHCHYFLSGRDSAFGNWDILKTQIEVVNAYVNDKNKVRLAHGEELERLLPENCILTREQTATHGERLQRMFFEHINQHLLNERGLHAEVASEEERSSPERQRMNRQASSAKSDRDYNYVSRLVEEKKNELLLLERELAEEVESVESIQSQKVQLIHDMSEVEVAFQFNRSQQKEELEQLQQEISSLSFNAVRLNTMAKKLTGTVEQQLVAIIRKAYIAVQYQQRGQKQKANDYFEELTKQLDNEMDLELAPIVRNVIEAMDKTQCDNSNSAEMKYN